MWSVLLTRAALAAEPLPSLAMPAAVVVEAGSGQAGAGVLLAGGVTPTASATLRGTVGITDRLALSGALQEPWGGLLLGLRYNVVETDAFRFAPYVFGIADDDLLTEDASDASGALSAGVGVAFEGGGATFRYDLSLPLVATGVNPLAKPLYVPFVGTSLCLTVRVTPRQSLRFGVESTFAPGVTYRYAPDRWYLQGVAMWSVVRGQPMLAAEVGLRF